MTEYNLALITSYYKALFAYNGNLRKAAISLDCTSAEITTTIRNFSNRVYQLMNAHKEYTAFININKWGRFPRCARDADSYISPQIYRAIEQFEHYHKLTPAALIKNTRKGLSTKEKFKRDCDTLLAHLDGKTLLELGKQYGIESTLSIISFVM